MNSQTWQWQNLFYNVQKLFFFFYLNGHETSLMFKWVMLHCTDMDGLVMFVTPEFDYNIFFQFYHLK